jgi:pectinesterase
MKATLSLFALVAFLFSAPAVWAALPDGVDVVVAADGSGRYTSLQEAISAAPMKTGRDEGRWVILVKPGTYRERIYVQRERGNILVKGEDAAKTIIAFDLNANLPGPEGKPIGTFRTPTVQIDGDGMVWENLTLANTAGPVGQALALRADGDRLVFRRCRFLGWQDTILVNRGRHLFEDCYIEGHVDFIFGAATAYFLRCHIHCLRDGYITAASTPQGVAHGFVFADCRLTGAPGVKTFLGRPWRNYARTVFLRTEMSEVVRPAGWDNWAKPDAEQTSFYAEFGSTGKGAADLSRVGWAKRLSAADSAKLTPQFVLAGSDGWDPFAR